MKTRYDVNDQPPQDALAEFQEEFLTDRKTEVSEFLNDSKLPLEKIKETAHKWKGFCDPYGFQNLTLYAKDIEKAVLNSEESECLKLLKEVDLYLSKKKLR